jgi:hypothetical protein
MQKSRAQVTSRQPVKMVNRTAQVVRKAAPAKLPVKAAAPSRKMVQAGATCPATPPPPTCTQSTTACPVPPSTITFPNCEDHTTLACIQYSDLYDPTGKVLLIPGNFDVTNTIIPGRVLDKAFPTADQVAACAQLKDSTCTFTASVEYTTTVVHDGLYSLTRVYHVMTDANCPTQASATYTYTIYFTLNDDTGPVITISPAVGDPGFAGVACSDGTNPIPTCGSTGGVEPCDCECIMLPGCSPNTTDICNALGTGTVTALGCDGNPITVYQEDSDITTDGCYSYQTRTFTAADECCNETQVCRVVRWVSDVTNPSEITITPSIHEFDQCVDPTQCESQCECIDLKCNPDYRGHGYDNLPDYIDYVLGVGTATDNCGSAQVTPKDSRVKGDCCNFSQKRTFTAADPCGNSVEACRIVRWRIDTEGPQVRCLSDKELSCPDPAHPYTTEEIDAAFDIPQVFDNCDGIITEGLQYTEEHHVDLGSGNTVYTRTWTIPSDSCRNAYTGPAVAQTITVLCHCADCDPTGPPHIECPAGIFTLPPSDQPPTDKQVQAVVSQLSITGFCQTPTVTTYSSPPQVFTDGIEYDYLVEATTPSPCNELVDCKIVFFVPNPGAPTINCGLNALLPCSNEQMTADQLLAAIQSQNPNQITTSGFSATPSLSGLITQVNVVQGNVQYTLQVTATATPISGPSETASCSLFVTVPRCPTAPTINCGGDVTLQCSDVELTADQILAAIRGQITTQGFSGTPTLSAQITSTVSTADGYQYSVTVTATSGNQQVSCGLTVMVPPCSKGCSRGFYAHGGLVVWDQSSDHLVQVINDQIQASLPFAQSTSFLNYFGFASNICGISTSVTLLGALSLNGGGCNQLAAQGVAALLNLAAFGSNYIIPTTCVNPDDTPITTLVDLYNAIQTALAACPSQTKCTALAACLSTANNNEGPNGIYCSTLVAADSTPAPGFRVTPKKLTVKPSLRKVVAPVNKRAVQPVIKKAVAPAPQRVIARPAVAPAPKKKTFVPGNAQ